MCAVVSRYRGFGPATEYSAQVRIWIVFAVGISADRSGLQSTRWLAPKMEAAVLISGRENISDT